MNWLSSMLVRKLPVDELCLHAIATYLNIHITVDYHGGFWTTLDIPHIHHDLATILSDIHLVYCGSCKYNLLCKNTALRSVGRKLMIHNKIHELPEATLVLCRVEEWNPIAGKLINEDIAELNLSNQDVATNHVNTDWDSTEIYDIYENVIGTIYYLPEDTRTKTPSNSLFEINVTSSSHPLFKCSFSKCKVGNNRQKEIIDHYRAMHRKTQPM